jgi:hypothetical protein
MICGCVLGNMELRVEDARVKAIPGRSSCCNSASTSLLRLCAVRCSILLVVAEGYPGVWTLGEGQQRRIEQPQKKACRCNAARCVAGWARTPLPLPASPLFVLNVANHSPRLSGTSGKWRFGRGDDEAKRDDIP